jgi:predicted MFS family arabinose efflux permease
MARLLTPAAVLTFTVFWSTLDRTVALPLVPVLARDFAVPVAVAGAAISVNVFALAALQLVWGPLSTRWGRVRVLWVSTAIAAAANVASALAPDAATFIATRAVSGGAYAATFAAVLVYIGDTLPVSRRPAVMANLATAVALAIAGGTVISGLVAELTSWRWLFAVYGLATVGLVWVLLRLPDPPRRPDEQVFAQLGRVARNPWAWCVYLLVVLEGFLLIGVFNFLPVALQQAGEGVLLSGIVTAAFGVAVIVVSQTMKLFVRRVRPWHFVLAGGVAATLAFAALLTGVSAITVLVGAALMGLAWALAHTTIQTWMTDVAADARALGMTFFSISLVLGGALGSAAGSVAAGREAFPVLFAAALIGAIAFAVAGAVARARYRVPWLAWRSSPERRSSSSSCCCASSAARSCPKCCSPSASRS